MSTVHCYDDDGLVHEVSSDSLAFSPAVYGIFIENDRLLLLSRNSTSLYTPPGCLLQANEVPTQAVRHYFRRLVGFTPALGSLLFVEDQYRWFDGRAWLVSALYYAVERPFTDSIHINETLEPEHTAVWVDLLDLQRSQFQFGFKAATAGISHLALLRR
jgi:ADP-ribose pyrophosphatase YjhB (NUDIX family)